jgi:uncharacterized protein
MKPKAALNLSKHKVSFEEAATVFQDALSLTGRDPDHSREEQRVVTFGLSAKRRILVVAHAERGGRIRIISARVATRTEKTYMKNADTVKDELREEYRREDFGRMVRGKYTDRCTLASNVVVISSDVQKAFPNAKAVNEALRGLLDLAKSTGLTGNVRSGRKTAAG